MHSTVDINPPFLSKKLLNEWNIIPIVIINDKQLNFKSEYHLLQKLIIALAPKLKPNTGSNLQILYSCTEINSVK